MRGFWWDRLATTGVALAGAAVVACALVALSHPLTFWSVTLPVAAALYLSVSLVGAAVARADRRNPVGWLLMSSAIALAAASTAYLLASAEHQRTGTVGWAGWWDGWPWVPAQGLLPVVGLLLFPDGRLPSRRWRPVLVVAVLQAVALSLGLAFSTKLLDFPALPNPAALPGVAGTIADGLFVTIVLIPPLSTLAAVSLHRRARRAADPRTAAAIRLAIPAAWVVAASWWSCILITAVGGADITALPFQILGVLTFAGAAWIAIRRYGLFDGRRVLHRTLVYGLLTGLVTVAFLLFAAVFRRLLPGGLGAAVAVAAATLLALPVRDVLQRAANRLVYGDRDNPYQVLVNLGRALEVATGNLLPEVTGSIRTALRLSYVEVRVAGSAMAAAGRPGTGVREEFPLVFAGETIGDLITESAEPFAAAERRLITGLLGQVAAAAHAVRLEQDLRSSRERIVGAAEEERRRLRRDLHDGLGPALAGVVLGLQRVRSRLTGDQAAAEQLDNLTKQTQAAVGDIRRLVYGLRPPALDELGLVGALTEQARSLGVIEVDGPAGELQLPAAVEVAAYRIALEAMTNTVRHAQAASTVVRIVKDNGSLCIEVADDGRGLPEAYRAGVGIDSMRGRATELGGSCQVGPRRPKGTLVRATIPLGS